MDTTLLNTGDVPLRIFDRLRQIGGYEWDEHTPAFHSSYDNWHFCGTRTIAPTLKSLPVHPRSNTAQGPHTPAFDQRTVEPKRGQDSGSPDTPADSPFNITVIARVSYHPLREERAFQLCRSLSKSVDPEGRHIARPIDFVRLPSKQGDTGPLVVSIFEAPGNNDLDRYMDYGPAYYREDKIVPGQVEPSVLEPPHQISIPSFLDFAIGAVECLELLHHGSRVVHGEIRGDAFHYKEESGQVRLVNFGSGNRSFEHGLTSTGWSSLSREAGANTKLSYISPEQTGRWPSEPDSRTDIYSLGILFWILLTRSCPFDGITPMDIIQGVLGRRIPSASSVREDVPDVIGRVIQKMTNKAIEDRYHSISGLRHDLVAIQQFLGQGDSGLLQTWKIATKDVSSYFMLPTTMVGREQEHDEIVSIIEKVSQRHIQSTKNGAQNISSHSGTSSSNFSGFNVGGALDVESSMSSSRSSGRRDSLPHERPSRASSNMLSSRSGRSVVSLGKMNQLLGSTIDDESSAPSQSDARLKLEATDVVGSLVDKRHSQNRRGRCEVVSIAGAAGVGKSFLVQSVQKVARSRGYFASSKFDSAQKTPFGPVLKLLSSLFKQVFSESEEETQFHQVLKSYVRPAWPMLSKVLQLPEFLLVQPQASGSSSHHNSTQSSITHSNTSILANMNSFGQNLRNGKRGPDGRTSRTSTSSRASVYSMPNGAQTTQDFLSQGSSTKSMRLVNTFLDVLRVFATHKLICFCLDDLQFADDESLELITQLISSRMRMVLIVTYRPDEMLPAKVASIIDPPNTEGIRYLKSNGIGITKISLAALTETDVNKYIASTLHRPEHEILPLAAVVNAKTGGNIFFIREMLRSLNRSSSIFYDYKLSAWSYDLDKIHQQYDSQTYHQVLDGDSVSRRLSELPDVAQAIVAWASLVGTSFSFEFIQRLLSGEFNTKDMQQNEELQSSYSQQETVTGLQALTQAYIVVASEDDDRFRFSHDRYVEAAATMRKISLPQMHFVVAQTMLKYYSADDTWNHLTSAHICEAVDIIRANVQHRSTYRKLLFDRAKTASESGARQTAIKCYVNCFALLQDDPWNDGSMDVYYDETLELHQRAAETYHFIGDFDRALHILKQIFLHAKTEVDKTAAWIMLSRIHVQRGDISSAFSSLASSLAALGVPVDENMSLEKCDTEFKDLSFKVQNMTHTNVVLHEVHTDKNLAAIGAVVLEAASAAFFCDRVKFYHMVLVMVNIHLKFGRYPQSGLGFVYMGMVAITRFKMFSFADKIGHIALDLLGTWTGGHQMAIAGAFYDLFLGHIQAPLPVTFASLDTALGATIVVGDRLNTILNFGMVAMLKFFGSANVADLEAFCTYGCEEIPNWQVDCRGGTMLLAVRQVCRSLQGKTKSTIATDVMSDETHDSPSYLQWISNEVAVSDQPITFYRSVEIAALFLYGHYNEAARIGEMCLSKLDDLWSARNTRFAMFFHGLALASCVWQKRIQTPATATTEKEAVELTASAIEKLSTYIEDISSWQTVNNVNYLSWSELLNAQLSELRGEFQNTLEYYENALDHASANGFIFDEALGNYLLGGYFLRRGAKRAAKGAIQESIVLYGHFEAVGVAQFLQDKHCELLQANTRGVRVTDVAVQTDFADTPDDSQFINTADNDINEEARPHIAAAVSETKGDRIDAWQGGSARLEAGSGLPLLDMLDLTSILESSQVISSILSIDQLLTTMCEIILSNCGGLASLAAIIVEEDDPTPGWSVVASGDLENGVKAYQPGLPLSETGVIAENVVLYSIRFRETVFLSNLLHDERFSNVSDVWLARNAGGKSVISIPITHGNKPLLGTLYLEGKPNCFTDRNLTVLGLLVNQVGISYSNALTMKAIKKVSASNISMVQSQKQALAQAREAEAKAKFAESEALRSVQLAEEAAKAKSIFLANVSHELRTPLNGLVGNSELLRSSKLDAEQTDMADSIRVSADLLLTVINDILDLTKLQADKMELFITAFKPRELLKEVVRSVSYSNSDKTKREVEIIQDIIIPPNMVFGDPVRIHQVLGNLISNSLKFTAHGTVTIGARVVSETDEHLELKFTVQDTGIGIPQEKLKKLFIPFSQADSSTARKYGGSGLGLSICRSLIESMMGGRIELESVEGQGTLAYFIVKFAKAGKEIVEGDTPEAPVVTVHEEIEPELPVPEISAYNDFSHVPRADVRICIAEDNMINQKIAIQFVRKLGFQHIDAYDNGLLAVEGLRKKAQEGMPYHLLLCDVQMPVCDGYEAATIIRKDPIDAVRGILIIAMTASAIQGDREKCLESGMNDYLAKPVRVQVLKKKLDQYLAEAPVPIPNLQKEAKEVAVEILREATESEALSEGDNQKPMTERS